MGAGSGRECVRANHPGLVLKEVVTSDGCDAEDLYDIALRELEIPLFVEVLNHCEGDQSRAAAMLGIHRATLRRKLRDYHIV